MPLELFTKDLGHPTDLSHARFPASRPVKNWAIIWSPTVQPVRL